MQQALACPLESKVLLQLILDRVFECLEPEEGAIVLRDPSGGYYRAASRLAAGVDGGWTVSQDLLHYVVEEGRPALVSDASRNELLLTATRSLLAVPLSGGNGTVGMIVLASRASVRRFSEEDRKLLVSLAGLAALWLRNVSLEEEAAECRRLKEEVCAARSIQVQLLRSPLPRMAGWDLLARSLPARGASGDLYLVHRLGDDVTAPCFFLLADVSGKGVGAALLTASLEAMVSRRLEADRTPAELSRTISRQLFRRTDSAKYATGFLAQLDPTKGLLRWVNAGHNPILVVHADGELETLTSTGPPFGLLPGAGYRTRETVLRPGDTLAVYSDGFVEAENRDEEEYGLKRFGQQLRQHRADPLPALAEALEKSLEQFTEGLPAADDRTLLLARRGSG